MNQVSICIPVYNGSRFILETLNSILCQTFPNYEIIISDDNSDDDSMNLIKNFFDKYGWRNVVLVNNKGAKGIGSNWNNCLKHANGKYIKFIFQDDIMYDTCLEEMVKFLEGRPDFSLVSCKRKFITDSKYLNEKTISWMNFHSNLQFNLKKDLNNFYCIDGTIFKEEFFFKNPKNFIGEPSTVLFRKSFIEKVGLFRLDLKQSLDYEYWFRFIKISKIAVLDKELIGFRIHDFQETNRLRVIKVDDFYIMSKIIFFNYFFLINNKLRFQLFFRVTYLGRFISKFIS
ncbi:glycosyltransferase [Algoriphagus zhangzhouensis]|uniref:Glycosyltransferase involved in cell wall bisynthesis n=1 Tax=Algoriphagus zhangzhouensis TaxID=1073327 RepID=A0A1M7ZKH4_9BACT|nr:glycosyltransferase [Algoriphagus zhangzhouensis]TDY42875.1 glycosyltransferase involved in cell wall biosynthesis [Algoriphagus zhangzhouensis]SHO65388.1 Glycosyltransferase involved in cell wall bisynthesis [Algoriphagus zhangzhouensis]